MQEKIEVPYAYGNTSKYLLMKCPKGHSFKWCPPETPLTFAALLFESAKYRKKNGGAPSVICPKCNPENQAIKIGNALLEKL